ncbi:DNA polymerase I [Acidihalobacter ferrooxydans]|uniref:DNA polymerase I n=1 Tax=Acidihalobacter ferrooxydans TaxID=1765967 RepID=A0A1P8UKU9_9GAMM|nr:DNA polymerase I [Acidihalobacter ferrooxydans]APZ44453.1 DNA polymerase I [Acidihalobacter ferrooxydans]
MSKPALILVDGSSYLYRAFHALPPLTNAHGEPTGAVYGVINMLKRLIKDYAPEHVGVIFDAKGKTFRDDLYADYKANRPPMPDALRAQIEPLHALIRAMGLPLLAVEGVEADDVIGTLACQAAAQGRDVLISSGDKDLAQLVDEHVTLVNTMSNTTLDRAGVIDKFGVPPERIVDYLALVGDSVDNVPGVEKCGPKTAVKWLQAYDSLDGIMAHADEVKGKVGDNLRAALAWLPQARELVTVKLDVPLEQGPDDLVPSAPDTDTLRALFTRLEFNTWLQELNGGGETAEDTATQATGHYECVLDDAELAVWIERLKQAEVFAFDTETTSLDYMQARVVGLSFAVEPGAAAYVPLAHDYPGVPEQLDREAVLERLRPLLESREHAKVGHHLKYDRNVLANHGITLEGIRHDTMLESYVLDATANRHDLDTLCAAHLDHRNIKYADVAGKGAKQIPFAAVGLEEATPYAAEDADMTLRLHRLFWPKLEAEPGLRKVYEEIEIPLLRVLSRIERNGVRIDAERLRKQSAALAERMSAIEKQTREIAGCAFNLGSPKQIQEILYDRLKLPVLRKTPKGQPSTAEDVLEELAAQHELPRLILDHRSLAKLKSTYTDRLPERVDPDTGRVHTSYHQAVASTGRLSSSEPNLQNIPVRTEEGRRIRQAFVAEPGNILIAADYSQIELRIMAHLSADPGLLKAFAEGQDIHRATAAEVFGETLDTVTTDQRRAAKAINFGLIYGMSAFGLARQLDIGRAEAQDYVERYFARYPGVREYMDRTRARAKEDGYVETLFGRRLYLPDINARNGQIRAQAERVAINAPMQGSAADIIKRAMIRVDRWIETQAPNVRMIMQVHDELVLEVPDSRLDETRAALREHMEDAAELAVPLIVDIGTGHDWEAAH